jgi:2,3-bisphosphoglycerate-dependent phosphoglycerate mutase
MTQTTRSLTILLLLLTACAPDNLSPTTFILVRHAEKGDDGTQDPDLKAEGVARAKELAHMLKDTPLAGIYSTDFKRTRNTVAPIADASGVAVQLYEAYEPDAIQKMIDDHRGGTVLISGHSNNIPWTANLLLGDETFKDYPESEYAILLVVTATEIGKASVVRLNY